MSDEEEILGIFPSFMQRGAGERDTFGFKGEVCKIVFTTERLIATKDKRFGGNKLFRPKPDYSYHKTSTRERMKMKRASAEKILKARKESLADILRQDIAVVELLKPRLDSWKLRVFMEDLDTPKYTFTIAPPNNPRYVEDFEEFLKNALPDKL